MRSRRVVLLTEIEAMGILGLRPWREMREQARAAALERQRMLPLGTREDVHRGSGRTWHMLLSALLTAARGLPVWIDAYSPRYAEQLVLLVQRWAIECGIAPSSLFRAGRPVDHRAISPVPTVEREVEFILWLREAAEDVPRSLQYASLRSLGCDWAQNRLVELDVYLQEESTVQGAVNRLINAHAEESWPDFGLLFADHHRSPRPQAVLAGFDTGRDFARDVMRQALDDPRITSELRVLASALDSRVLDMLSGADPEDPQPRVDALRAWMIHELRVEATCEYAESRRERIYIVESHLPCGCPHATETRIADPVIRVARAGELEVILREFRHAAARNLSDAIVEHLARGVEHNRRWLQQMNYRDMGSRFAPLGGPWQGP